jgi:hypothetical protein
MPRFHLLSSTFTRNFPLPHSVLDIDGVNIEQETRTDEGGHSRGISF